MMFTKDDSFLDETPDSEKLRHVYAYVLKKEREEMFTKIRKWIWRIGIIFMLYFSYVQLVWNIAKDIPKMQAASSSGNTNIAVGTVQKLLSDFIAPIASNIAKQTATEMMNEVSTSQWAKRNIPTPR